MLLVVVNVIDQSYVMLYYVCLLYLLWWNWLAMLLVVVSIIDQSHFMLHYAVICNYKDGIDWLSALKIIYSILSFVCILSCS